MLLRKVLCVCVCLCTSVAVYGQAVGRLVALKTKLAITRDGAEVPKAVILIQDGIIKAVGPAEKVKIPWNADVVEAADLIAAPTYVLAHTSQGLDRENESMPDVPFLSTYDSINPFSRFFKDALRNGIATIAVLPGNNTRFGGMGTIVKPVGATLEQMLIRRNVGLKISLMPGGGLTRMGHMQRLRRYLQEAKRYFAGLERRKKEAREAGKRFEEEVPPERAVLRDLFSGKLLAFIYCPLASDVVRALELMKEYNFKGVLVLGRQTYRAASLIAKAKVPVILPPEVVFFEEDPLTGEVHRRVLPVIFRKAGVSFAFQVDPRSYRFRFPWQVAALAIKHGLSRSDAFKAWTTTPAGIIGMARKIGELKPGYQANLQLLTGDPFSGRTWVDKVYIGGEVVYDRAKDKYLKELLGTKK